MNETFPIRIPALRVQQPLGEFCLVTLPADLLLSVCFSNQFRLEAITEDGGFEFSGSQRRLLDDRLTEIGRYIDTVDAAFPNSIILAANYREDGRLEDQSAVRWEFQQNGHPDLGWLVIPTRDKLAAVVDGQHRLFGFQKSQVESRKSMALVCSVYLDLPHAFQAYVFATINYNQKPVDKSQTYELYAMDLETGGPESWTPEKSAVFICRKLNTMPESPFVGHIVVAALSDESLQRFVKRQHTEWAVSTACIVEGILRLISTNPKRDRTGMHKFVVGKGRLRNILPLGDNPPPLRRLYQDVNDLAIYTIVQNYFRAVSRLLWKGNPATYIQKTVGVQALFDVLKTVSGEALEKRAVKEDFFYERLRPCEPIDFADNFFQASGTGRQRIRNCLELCLSISTLEGLKASPEDQANYERLCSPKGVLS